MENKSLPEMYPNIDDLLRVLPEEVSIHSTLETMLREKYARGASQYITDKQHSDGRILNACMDRNSLLDALEELTDAIFNLLVACLKQQPVDQRSQLGHVLGWSIINWRLIRDLLLEETQE